MGEREIIYLSLHCHHQNDSYIEMGSDESHFNVSLIVRVEVTRQCPQTTTFEEKGEPNQIHTQRATVSKDATALVGHHPKEIPHCFRVT